MTKTPGEFEPPKPISKAERDARKTFRKLDAEKAMTEHKIHPLSGRLGAFSLAHAPAPAVLIALTWDSQSLASQIVVSFCSSPNAINESNNACIEEDTRLVEFYA